MYYTFSNYMYSYSQCATYNLIKCNIVSLKTRVTNIYCLVRNYS